MDISLKLPPGVADADRLRRAAEADRAGANANGSNRARALPGDIGSAAEELTFQFSETVEAESHALEDRLAELQQRAEDSISIKQVHQVLSIMEGREGYAQLRSLARRFAEALGEGRDDAFDLLALDSFTPQERYGMLRLASEALEVAGHRDPHGTLDGALKNLAGKSGDELRRFFDASSVARAGALAPRELAEPMIAPHFQLLATKPTARSVFDSAAEFKGTTSLSASLATMQRAWSAQLGRAEQIGALIMLSRLAGVVQTMLSSAAELSRRAGGVRHRDPDLVRADARTLIDIAHSSVPANLLDKLASSMLPRGGAWTRPSFFSFMHGQVRTWPDGVWASADSKGLVLQQLVRKQAGDVPSRLPRSSR